jgi:hypothetical protein
VRHIIIKHIKRIVPHVRRHGGKAVLVGVGGCVACGVAMPLSGVVLYVVFVAWCLEVLA